MTPFGFEPKTYCLEGSCSIQLSYGASILILCNIFKSRARLLYPPDCYRDSYGASNFYLTSNVLLVVMRKKKGMISHPPKCRGGQIRTDDLLLPKQARYRATLHPEEDFSFLFNYVKVSFSGVQR